MCTNGIETRTTTPPYRGAPLCDFITNGIVEILFKTNPLSLFLISLRFFQVDATIDKFRAYSQPFNVTISTSPAGLSPSSLQSFLKSKSLPGLVLTDYNETFTNR